jgi:hypothetical protein
MRIGGVGKREEGKNADKLNWNEKLIFSLFSVSIESGHEFRNPNLIYYIN